MNGTLYSTTTVKFALMGHLSATYSCGVLRATFTSNHTGKGPKYVAQRGGQVVQQSERYGTAVLISWRKNSHH